MSQAHSRNFRRDFTNGFCCAVATLINQHGCATEARDLFRSAGTEEDIRKYADKLDIEVFEKHGLLKSLASTP